MPWVLRQHETRHRIATGVWIIVVAFVLVWILIRVVELLTATLPIAE